MMQPGQWQIQLYSVLPHKPGKTTGISVEATSTLYSGVPGMVQVTHELKLQEMGCTLMRRTEHSSERPLESIISVNLAKAKADCCVCVCVSEWQRGCERMEQETKRRATQTERQLWHKNKREATKTCWLEIWKFLTTSKHEPSIQRRKKKSLF